MVAPDANTVVKVLLRRYGHRFSEDLGIDTETNRPQALFCLLVGAILASTRIGHEIALRSARILFKRGWTSPRKMLDTTWAQRVEALDEGGYVRYDERTATTLDQDARMVLEKYRGDLRRLREDAGRDLQSERTLLKEFKGIGDVGADIFLRDVQAAWPELFPFADERVLASAEKLGLPRNAKELAGLVRGRRAFARLVAALVWVQLESRHEEVLQLAGSSNR